MTSPYRQHDAEAHRAKLHARAAQAIGLVLGLCLGLALSFMAPAEAARNGSGTYSLPNTGSVPNPVVSGTAITAAWANGTLTDLGTEITNSVAVDGQSTMTAPLKLASGSVSAPGLTFGVDTNTGIYRIGADNIGISTGATKQVDISQTAVAVTLPTTITTTISNSDGLNATGYGTGAGVRGYGGASSGSYGVMGIAGSSGTAGGYFIGSAAGGMGLWAVAQQGGLGAYTAGGASSDGGVGGSSLQAIGGTSIGGIGGFGINATGGVGSSIANAGAGLAVAPGNVSTGANRADAIRVTNGDIDMDGVVDPSSDTAILNSLTPANIVKSWASIETNGSNGCTVNDGFNITSCAISGDHVIVTIAEDMVDTNFACSADMAGSGSWANLCNCGPTLAGQAAIYCGNIGTQAEHDLGANAVTLSFIAIGQQ